MLSKNSIFCFSFHISSSVIEIPCVCDDTVLKYQAATVKPKAVNTRRPHSFFCKLNWKITTHRLWNPAAQLLSLLCRNHCLNYFKIRVSFLYISSLKLATIVTICFTALLETSTIRIILELGPDWFFSEVDVDAGTVHQCHLRAHCASHREYCEYDGGCSRFAVSQQSWYFHLGRESFGEV